MSKAKERGVTLGDDSTDSDIGKIIRQSFCDALVPVLNYGFRSFKLVSALVASLSGEGAEWGGRLTRGGHCTQFGKHHFWDFLEKLLDDQLEKVTSCATLTPANVFICCYAPLCASIAQSGVCGRLTSPFTVRVRSRVTARSASRSSR
jgi:hypothetical protein